MLLTNGVDLLSGSVSTTISWGVGENEKSEQTKADINTAAKDVNKRMENNELSSTSEARNALNNVLDPIIEDYAQYLRRDLVETGGSTLHVHENRSVTAHQDSEGGYNVGVQQALETLHKQMHPDTIQQQGGSLHGDLQGAAIGGSNRRKSAEEIAQNAQVWIEAYSSAASQLNIVKSVLDLALSFEEQTHLENSLDIASLGVGFTGGLVSPILDAAATRTGQKAVLDFPENHATAVARVVSGDPEAEVKHEGSTPNE
jgi:hypothetical protein